MCIVDMDSCDDLLGCGFNKPLAKLKIGDVDHLIHSVALHSTILQKLTNLQKDFMKPVYCML